MAKVDDFRKQYPEYDDLDDETLARKLHAKSYSDMDFNDFRRRFLGKEKSFLAEPNRGQALGTQAGMEIAKAGGPLEYAGKVGGNTVRELEELKRGAGQLLTGGAYAATLPARHVAKAAMRATGNLMTDPTLEEETAGLYKSIGKAVPEAGKAVLKQFGEELTNPAKAFTERPLTTTLDVSGAASLPGAAVRLGGRLAGTAARVAARAGAEEAAGAAARTAAKATELGEKMTLRNVAREGVRQAEEGSPAFGRYMEGRRVQKAIRTIRGEEKSRFFRRRGEEFTEIADRISAVPKAERERLPQVWMGLDEGADLSPKAQEAVEWWRSKSAQEQADLIASGRLTEEGAVVRAMQPARLAKGGEEAFHVERAAKFEPAAAEQVKESTRGLLAERAAKRGLEVPEKAGVVELHRMLVENGDKVPVYFPFLKSAETAPWDFLPQGAVKTARPGFTKKSGGVLFQRGTYIKDPARAIARHTSQRLRAEEATRTIQRVIADPRVRKITKAAEVGPGEELFAPDGLLAFYRGQVNTGAKLLKRLEETGDVEDALATTIREALMDPEFAKSFVGVSRSKNLYAVPKAAANELRGQFAKTHPAVRILWDKPADYWRFLVLAARPAWLVNNVVGNTAFSLLSGTSPSAYLKALQRKYLAAIPEDALGSGFTQTESWSTNLGGAADTRLGQIMQAVSESKAARVATAPVRFVGKWSERANVAVDNYFRRAKFITEIESEAGKKVMREAGGLETAKPESFANATKKIMARSRQEAAEIPSSASSAGGISRPMTTSPTSARPAPGTQAVPSQTSTPAAPGMSRAMTPELPTPVRTGIPNRGIAGLPPPTAYHEIDDLEALTAQARHDAQVAVPKLQQLYGGSFIDSRIKEAESLRAKMTGKENGLRGITDTIGTRVATTNADEAVARLKQAGAEILDDDGSMQRRIGGYEGRHVIARFPGQTVPVEIQFMSPQTAAVQELSHEFYDVIRKLKPGENDALRDAAIDAMEELYRKAPRMSPERAAEVQRQILRGGKPPEITAALEAGHKAGEASYTRRAAAAGAGGAQQVKDLGAKLTKALDFAEKIDYVGPEGVKRAVDAVNDFFPDYGAASPFQRQVLRRVFPFVSFMRHVWGLVARLPLDYPGRGALVNALSEAGLEYQRDRFKDLGVDIEKAPGYRKGLFPVTGDEKGITALSSGGFNPLSSMALSGDVQLEPNLSTLGRSAAMQSDPRIQAALEGISGRKLFNAKPFTRPDVVEVNGRFWRVDENGKVIEVPAPTPTPADVLARSIPQVRLTQDVTEPYETFDLPGPEGMAPRPLKGALLPKRKTALEALLAYLGAPIQRLERSEFRSQAADPTTIKRVLAELSRRQAAAARAEAAQ